MQTLLNIENLSKLFLQPLLGPGWAEELPLGLRLPEVTYPKLAIQYRLWGYGPYTPKFPSDYFTLYLHSYYFTICVNPQNFFQNQWKQPLLLHEILLADTNC